MITIYRNGINVIGVRICKDPPWARFYHEIHWHEHWYLQRITYMSVLRTNTKRKIFKTRQKKKKNPTRCSTYP